MSEVYKPKALFSFEDSYYLNGTGLEEPGEIVPTSALLGNDYIA